MENLLESYFVQIDGTFDKLEAIGAPIMVVMFMISTIILTFGSYKAREVYTQCIE